ncbi:MAG: HAD family hydrolase [Desulfovibrio sp.]|nr:HAD family hydrolase [Desulfovibrio sp.]
MNGAILALHGFPADRPLCGRPFLCFLLDELHSLGTDAVAVCTPPDSPAALIFGSSYRGMALLHCHAGTESDAFQASIGSLDSQTPVLAFDSLAFPDAPLARFAERCASSGLDAGILKLKAPFGEDTRAGACWFRSAGSASFGLLARMRDPAGNGRTFASTCQGRLVDPATDPAGAEAFFRPRSIRGKAVFLDRDGTVNVERHYLFRPEDLDFIEGMPEFIAMWMRWGYRIIVATNQSGIARGFYSAKDMKRLHACMNERLARKGARIDAFYYCPHHPDITGPCDCRKPKPGMLEKAVFDFNLDPGQCILFGDKESDLQAGRACGIFSVQVR